MIRNNHCSVIGEGKKAAANFHGDFCSAILELIFLSVLNRFFLRRESGKLDFISSLWFIKLNILTQAPSGPV